MLIVPDPVLLTVVAQSPTTVLLIVPVMAPPPPAMAMPECPSWVSVMVVFAAVVTLIGPVAETLSAAVSKLVLLTLPELSRTVADPAPRMCAP